MSRKICAISVFLLTFGQLCEMPVVQAGLVWEGPVSEADRKRAEFAWAGMVAARGLARSGKCHIRIHWAVTRKGEMEIDDDHEVFFAVDDAQGAVRFDRKAPMHFVRGDDPKRERYTEVRTMKYVRTPEKSLSWESGRRTRIYSRSADDPRSSMTVNPFEPRILGMVALGMLRDYHSVQDTLEGRAEDPVHQVAFLGESIVELQWLYEKPLYSFRDRIRIDREQGFSPVHYLAEYKEKRPDEKWHTINDITVTWQKVAEVWLPKTALIEQRHDELNCERLEMVFQWEEVNTPVDPSLFTADGLGIDHFARVLDDRSGTVIEVDRLNVAESPALQPATAEPLEASNRWRIFLAVHAVILAAVIVGWYWKKRR